MKLPWLVWTLIAWIVLAALVRAASGEPHEARWADPSEQAVAYEWQWAPAPEVAPLVWTQPPWEALEGPAVPEPWPHCWGGTIDPPGGGHVRVRVVDSAGQRSDWSLPRAVPEPPGMLALGVLGIALARHSRHRPAYRPSDPRIRSRQR